MTTEVGDVHDDDAGSWALAGAVGQLPGDVSKASFEQVRLLSSSELETVSAADGLLARLTVGSPHQRLLDRYEVLQAAVAEVAQPGASEALSARLGRASEALRAWASQAATLAEAIRDDLGDALKDERGETAEALEAWRGSDLRSTCTALAEDGRLEVASHNGEAILVVVASADPPRRLRLDQLVGAVLATSEGLHFRVLADAEEPLHEASRIVRALEGEVLLGAPVLMRMSGSSMTFKELRSDLRVIAEMAVRVAKSALAEPTDGTTPPDPDELPLTVLADSTDSSTKSPEQPEVGTESVVVPPINVAAVAAVLNDSISRLEQVWSDAVDPGDAFAAAEADKQRFSNVAAALLRQSEDAERALRGTGSGVIPHFPLRPEDLADLNPEQPQASGDHAAFLPQLYVLKGFLAALEAIGQPLSMTIGPGGTIESMTFNPGTIARLKAHAALLGRCAGLAEELAGGPPSSTDTTVQWLRESALRAFDAALPEAVALYAHLAARLGADLGGLEAIVERVVLALAAGSASVHAAQPVTVPVAYHVIERLARS